MAFYEQCQMAGAIVLGMLAASSPALAQSTSYKHQTHDREPLHFAGPEVIERALQRPRPQGYAIVGPRGITVPPPPPDALTPEPAGSQQISVIVRRTGQADQRISGRRQLSLTMDPATSGNDAQLDLDITAEPFDHTHRVSGRWQHQFPVRLLINAQDSPMWPWKAAYSEVPQTRNIARAIVVLTDECGHYIRQETSASGSFSFDWTPAGCDIGQVTVYSVTDTDKVGVGRWNNGPIADANEFTNLSADYRAYSYTQTFDIDDAEDGLNLGTITVPQNSDAARGFFIMNNMRDALAYYNAMPGISKSELPKINVEHTEGLKPANIDCDEGGWGSLLRFNFYSFGIDPGFIHIPWDCTDSGFDAHAHVHETVHYFHRHFLRENPNYNQFGEGMSNVQAALIRGLRWMSTAGAGLLENLDVNSRMACWDGQSWESRIDTFDDASECEDSGGTQGFPQAVVWDANLANQGWLPRIAYDLATASGGEDQTRFITADQSPNGCGGACEFGQFDNASGNTAALDDVLIHYLGGALASGENPNYVDRGLDGLDMTDLLDGFICRGHATPAQVEAIAATAMGLDYDAAGAPNTCPHPND